MPDDACDDYYRVLICVWPGMKFDMEAHAEETVTVRLPDPSTRIGDMTLRELRSIREARFPDCAKAIGKNWFAGSAIEKITIPADVRDIPARAFADCTKL